MTTQPSTEGPTAALLGQILNLQSITMGFCLTEKLCSEDIYFHQNTFAKSDCSEVEVTGFLKIQVFVIKMGLNL